ncbi:TPA: molecular chaperone [Providencia stuartii]|nr:MULTISPECIES: molecular chaperone [Providencia]APG50826.1 pilus assembly protein [Providencia stuartii]AVL39239.1 molecular chaperone [Providencia stuartii]MBG5904276.1 molecular chaperone [Providencia stuartii]MBG5910838.1 molecular chaperone [Providencia stuartii]MBG5915498.1 molecular chaperone [Providencia stuartii]
MMKYFLALLTLLLSSLFNSAIADGGVLLNQTRVIFLETDKNTKATIQNRSNNTYLIKVNALISPDSLEKAPFLVNPPLFRMEPQSQNTVVIVPNQIKHLPKDRESVFYLSFLAIPSIPKEGLSEESDNYSQVSFGLQMVIKLFYRPESIIKGVNSSASQLTFQQKVNVLVVNNPTAYFQTFSSLKVNGQQIDNQNNGMMVAPFSEIKYHINQNAKEVTWRVVNDFGGESREYHYLMSHTEKK